MQLWRGRGHNLTNIYYAGTNQNAVQIHIGLTSKCVKINGRF